MRLPGWAFLVGIVALVAATALCGVGAFVMARQFAIDIAEAGPVAVPAINVADLPTPTATVTAAPTNTLPPGVTPSPTVVVPTATVDPLLQYEIQDPRRVNVLLMGIDQRRGETGAFHTDTMIVASIDPASKTAGLLSIPRDLYVDIPGFQQDRINQANFFGDLNNYPGGGPALAMETIRANLGIRVEKYVLVNFSVFETVVNLVAPNGVEVCPQEVIDDPDYPDAGYGIIAVHFDPGCQRLDAVRLLQYARTRATFGGDFDRALRQQETIQALREEVASAGGIVNLLGVAPQLWTELADSYKTNMTLDEIISLGLLALEIPRENIRTGQIGIQQTRPATTVTNDQVLVPVHTAMRELFAQVFSSEPGQPVDAASAGGATTTEEASGAATVTDLAELRTRSQAEAAQIVIFNNTTIAGLAGLTREFLASRQVTVADVGNIDPPLDEATYIRDYTGKPNTARYLARLLNIPEANIRQGTDALTTADVMVVVGSDIQPLLRGDVP
ncbi:MAG: LCP family protein [Chloroflexi bacterium]|nr:LCP family protein [Chloroflexota bacterium]